MFVYEELFNLAKDPNETTNLINSDSYQSILKKMRLVWRDQISIARGTATPKVLRYTIDSQHQNIKH
jgi:hypothetical protein